MTRRAQSWNVEETAFIVNHTDTCRRNRESWNDTIQAALKESQGSDRTIKSIRHKLEHLWKTTNQQGNRADFLQSGRKKIELEKLPIDLQETIREQSSLLQANQKYNKSQWRNGSTLKRNVAAPIAGSCAPPPISGTETAVKVGSDQDKLVSSHN